MPKSERDLPSEIQEDSNTAIDFHHQKEQFEKDFIVTALRRFDGRINQTATHAGIPKNTLIRKIRKYAINPTDYGPVDQFGEEN